MTKQFGRMQNVFENIKKTSESNFIKCIDNLLCHMEYFNRIDSTLTKNKNSKVKIWNKKSVPHFI